MAFYLGTGGYDIGAMACFLGLPGGRSWERTFHRHSKKIHTEIISVTNTIMAKAFEDEVIATIREKLENELESDEIEEVIKKYKAKQFDKLPENVKQIGIAVSYDMG